MRVEMINHELQLGAKHKIGVGLETTAANVDYQSVRNDTTTIINEKQEIKPQII